MFKGIFKSLTMGFNGLTIVLLILDVLGGTDIIKNNPDWAVLFTALSNILLRFKTNKGLADK
jgi:hypothetical protein